MKCKTLHNNLIFFLEKELLVSEMEQVKEHLESCPDCAHFAEEMQKTLGILETEKTVELNPYFYTRVKARMESQQEEALLGRPVFSRILQPLAFSILLLLGIYSGINLGQPHKAELAVNTLSEQQMIPYLNEMDAEPIEAFLMK